MATARLVASAYSRSATSVNVLNPTNMYTNIDSTSYADLTHANSNTNTYYVYIRGFNFSSIPSNATVTAFEIKIKGYESNLSTSSRYAPCLANNTTAISGTTASSNFTSSSKTITIPTDSLTWSTITGYGINFGIRVAVKRSDKNTKGHLYIYGAEITVVYTVPASATAYIKVNGSWVPASAVYKKISGSWVQQSDLANVFDNGVDYVTVTET